MNNFDLYQRLYRGEENIYKSSSKCRLLRLPDIVLVVAVAGIAGRLYEHPVLIPEDIVVDVVHLGILRRQHEGLYDAFQ